MLDLAKKSAFIMVGWPGSGKSTLAQQICQRFHCHYLSSDEIREKVFQKLRFDLLGDEAMSPFREQAYQLMYDTAITLLKQRRKVVLDATHLEVRKRQPVVQKLLTTIEPTRLCYVLVQTPLEVIEERMKNRQQEQHNERESLYDGWKRISGYFLANQNKGLISWPDPAQEKIDCVTHEQLLPQLA